MVPEGEAIHKQAEESSFIFHVQVPKGKECIGLWWTHQQQHSYRPDSSKEMPTPPPRLHPEATHVPKGFTKPHRLSAELQSQCSSEDKNGKSIMLQAGNSTVKALELHPCSRSHPPCKTGSVPVLFV